MTALASNKRGLKCPVCERTVERQSRQQEYCSTRCRKRAWREKIPEVTHDSGRGTNPPKFSNADNVLQWLKMGSSLSANGPINLLGGGSWKWPDAGQVDAKTISKIRWCEVGGELLESPE